MKNPLLAALPRLFKVEMRGSSAAWIESSLRFAAQEAAASRPGTATVLSKLSELSFVEAIRRYVDSVPDDRKGWLGGLRDRFVARVRELMHARPGHPWTVEELAAQQLRSGTQQIATVAEQVGYDSEAVFSRAFKREFGQPPATWRRNGGHAKVTGSFQ